MDTVITVQFCCPGVRDVHGVPKVKRKKKFDKQIVALPLQKMGEKNVVPKSGESKKKKCYVYNIFTINHT